MVGEQPIDSLMLRCVATYRSPDFGFRSYCGGRRYDISRRLCDGGTCVVAVAAGAAAAAVAGAVVAWAVLGLIRVVLLGRLMSLDVHCVFGLV